MVSVFLYLAKAESVIQKGSITAKEGRESVNIILKVIIKIK